MEDTFGVRMVGTTLQWDRLTPRTVARLILQEDLASHDSFLVRLQPPGDLPPLFCFPGVDGHLLKFRHLAEQLGPEQPVYGLQPPGLEGGEPCETIAEIAAQYAHRSRTVQPAGPYRLMGFSLGGVFALEAARQLQEQGERVESLFLVDSSLASMLKYSLCQRMVFHLQYLWKLPRTEVRPYLAERAVAAWIRLRGTLRRIPREQRDIDVFGLAPNYARIALANLRAAGRYAPQPFHGQGVLFRAAVRVKQSPLAQSTDETGWAEMFPAGLTIIDLPGAHRDLLREPYVSSLAQAVRNLLQSGTASSSWLRQS